jgi:L-iditol 2-dehydrogenase
MTWAYKVDGPGFVKRVELPVESRPLIPGQIRLRFRAGGLCGSDMPLLHGVQVESISGLHDGAPIHEIVGEVVESASRSFSVGQRVVGTGGAGAGGIAGLTEMLVESDQNFIPIPDGISDVEAVPIQSIATVIRAANTLPDVTGERIAVIGAGPIGLAFLHLLRQRGAGHLTAIDPVPRKDAALHYGADEFVPTTSAGWVSQLDDASRPKIVIEAVGHQHGTIRDALRAVADWGFVYGFGAADENDYVLPYREMYERGLTLRSGRTLGGWVDVLTAGRDYLAHHRDDFAGYVTHTIPIEDAQTAYSLYARPQVARLKVALTDQG